MKRTLLALSLIAGCQLSMSLTLPAGQLDELARTISTIGHPLADYEGASVVGGSAGGCAGEGPRYVDVAIRYRRKLQKADNTMTVRLHVESTKPCKVRSEVLSDDGPDPILLDNDLASPEVGRMVCEALEGSPAGGA